MKCNKNYLSLILVFLFATFVNAQKIVQQAKISIKTETTLPDNLPTAGPVGEGVVQRITINGATLEPGGTIETITNVTFKNKMRKEITNSDFGKFTTIYDGETEKLITLTEMMGRKDGYYSTPEDREKQQKQVDSFLATRPRDGARNERSRDTGNAEPTIEYLDETMKIAGQICKKAIIKWKDRSGDRSVEVWYLPNVKMGDGYSKQPAGGTGGGINFSFVGGRGARRGGGTGGNVRGLDKIEGFPMKYEVIGQNGYKIVWEVTKIDFTAEVDDKEFEVPKGFELKPQSEMMNMFRGGMRAIERSGNN